MHFAERQHNRVVTSTELEARQTHRRPAFGLGGCPPVSLTHEPVVTALPGGQHWRVPEDTSVVPALHWNADAVAECRRLGACLSGVSLSAHVPRPHCPRKAERDGQAWTHVGPGMRRSCQVPCCRLCVDWEMCTGGVTPGDWPGHPGADSGRPEAGARPCPTPATWASAGQAVSAATLCSQRGAGFLPGHSHHPFRGMIGR